MKYVALALLFVTYKTFSASLHLEITNVSSEAGNIMVAVHNGAESFPSNDDLALAQKIAPAQNPATVVVKDLKPGEYAVAVFHDANSDEILNTNFLGIPKESFGFSNNPRIFFGPPSFANAKLILKKGEDLKSVIQLKSF